MVGPFRGLWSNQRELMRLRSKTKVCFNLQLICLVKIEKQFHVRVFGKYISWTSYRMKRVTDAGNVTVKTFKGCQGSQYLKIPHSPLAFGKNIYNQGTFANRSSSAILRNFKNFNKDRGKVGEMTAADLAIFAFKNSALLFQIWIDTYFHLIFSALASLMFFY